MDIDKAREFALNVYNYTSSHFEHAAAIVEVLRAHAVDDDEVMVVAYLQRILDVVAEDELSQHFDSWVVECVKVLKEPLDLTAVNYHYQSAIVAMADKIVRLQSTPQDMLKASDFLRECDKAYFLLQRNDTNIAHTLKLRIVAYAKLIEKSS